jgi:hypothetical protein
LAIDAGGNLYIGDSFNYVIRKVALSTGIITTVAGNGTQGYSGDGGPATAAELNGYNNLGVAVDGAGNLYIADTRNQRIRKVDALTQIITTVAGTGVAGYSAGTESRSRAPSTFRGEWLRTPMATSSLATTTMIFCAGSIRPG